MLGLSCFLSWNRHEINGWRAFAKCDWPGIIIFVASANALLVLVMIGGTILKWHPASVITILSTAVVGFTVLIIHQKRIANPCFKPELFRKWGSVCAFFSTFTLGLTLSMTFYHLVLFWEGVRDFSPMMVGTVLLCETLTFPVTAAVVGVIIKKTGYVKWASCLGSVVAVVTSGLFWCMDQNTSLSALVIINMGAGIGLGIRHSALIMTVLCTQEKRLHGHAIAMRTLVFSAGQCLGISVGVALFQSNFHYKVQNTDMLQITAESLLRMMDSLVGGHEIKPSIVYALRWVWGATCVVDFIGGILLCTAHCPRVPEDKANISDIGGQSHDQEPPSVKTKAQPEGGHQDRMSTLSETTLRPEDSVSNI